MGINNVLTLNVDLFDEYRDKMLLTPRSVTFVVGNSFKDLNLGSLKKHGIEVEAEYNKTINSGLNFFIKGMVGFNENRIIYKDDPPFAPEYMKQAGKPLDAQLAGTKLTGTGYYTTINDIHNNVSPILVEQLFPGEYKFLDYNSDGQITALDKFPVKGSFYPPITYSFSSGLSYKGFDFSFLFSGNIGKYVDFNGVYEIEFNYSAWRVHTCQLDYWTPSNPDASHSTMHFAGSAPPALQWAGGDGTYQVDLAFNNHFWRKADYLRLKEVYAGYTFNPAFLKHLIGVSNLVVYATGNNLWTLSNLIEGDPERKDFFLGFYPQMMTFKFGARFSF